MTEADRYILDRVKRGKFTYDGKLGGYVSTYVIKVGKYFVWVANGPGFYRYGTGSHMNYGQHRMSAINQFRMFFRFQVAKRKHKIRYVDEFTKEYNRLYRRVSQTQTQKVYRNE